MPAEKADLYGPGMSVVADGDYVWSGEGIIKKYLIFRPR